MNSYQKIKKIADERGTSIAAIESGAWIGNGTIKGWDTGSPRVDNLMKVAAFLDVPVAELIGDELPNQVPRNIDRYGLRGER